MKQIVLAGAVSVCVGLTCLGLTAGVAGTVESEEAQASPAPGVPAANQHSNAIDVRTVPQGRHTLLQKPAGVAPGSAATLMLI